MSACIDRIANALARVEKAREQCPFHGKYAGGKAVAFGTACPVCGADRKCDGGTCVIDRAEHAAVLEIEEAMADTDRLNAQVVG